MKEIQDLETRNSLLTNEIARLNTGRQTKVEQKRIDGNFEEIEMNKEIIKMLKNQNNQ